MSPGNLASSSLICRCVYTDEILPNSLSLSHTHTDTHTHAHTHTHTALQLIVIQLCSQYVLCFSLSGGVLSGRRVLADWNREITPLSLIESEQSLIDAHLQVLEVVFVMLALCASIFVYAFVCASLPLLLARLR